MKRIDRDFSDTEQMNNLYRTACRKNFLNSARSEEHTSELQSHPLIFAIIIHRYYLETETAAG